MQDHETNPDGQRHQDIDPNAGQNQSCHGQPEERGDNYAVVDKETEDHDRLLAIAGEVEEEPSEEDNEESKERKRMVD